MVTPADRLREKANGLRSPVRYMSSVGEVIVAPTGADEREAVLLDLLADYVDALDDAGCDTELRSVSISSVPGERPHTVVCSTAFERVHKDGCPRCSLLARIEEIA